jgi:hypothetical protein
MVEIRDGLLQTIVRSLVQEVPSREMTEPVGSIPARSSCGMLLLWADGNADVVIFTAVDQGNWYSDDGGPHR